MNCRTEKRTPALLFAGLFLGLLACAQAPAPKLAPAPDSWEVEFRGANGQETFSLERIRDGFHLEDASGHSLARLRPGSAGVAVFDAHNNEMGRVVPVAGDDPGLRVVDASGALLFQMVVEKDGDFTLRDAAGARVYEVKLRAYGYKVMGRDGAVESRVRSKPGKVSVRDARGNTVLYTRDSIPTRAVVVLTLDRVPFEFAAGMAVAVVRGMVPQ